MPELLVPPGTKTQELIQMSLQRVDNGYVYSKVLLMTETNRQPYQVQSTNVFLNTKDALAQIESDLA